MVSDSLSALAKIVRDAQSRSSLYWAWHSATRGEDCNDRIFQMYEDAACDLSNALEIFFEAHQKEQQ